MVPLRNNLLHIGEPVDDRSFVWVSGSLVRMGDSGVIVIIIDERTYVRASPENDRIKNFVISQPMAAQVLRSDQCLIGSKVLR